MDLKLIISNENLAKFLEVNQRSESDETPYINVGIMMNFIDSNGKEVKKEFIIGAVQYTDNSYGSITYEITQKELTVY